MLSRLRQETASASGGSTTLLTHCPEDNPAALHTGRPYFGRASGFVADALVKQPARRGHGACIKPDTRVSVCYRFLRLRGWSKYRTAAREPTGPKGHGSTIAKHAPGCCSAYSFSSYCCRRIGTKSSPRDPNRADWLVPRFVAVERTRWRWPIKFALSADGGRISQGPIASSFAAVSRASRRCLVPRRR